MKNFAENKLLVYVSSIITLFCIFLFLVIKMQYSIVVNDDMLELVANKYEFSHGRFVTELIGIFFVRLIPSFFAVNIQSFTFISQAVLKSLFYVLLVYIISSAFYRFKQKDICLCLIILLTNFSLFSFLARLDFIWGFDTLMFFFGYVIPFIFFAPPGTKLQIFTYYKKNLPKKTLLYL